MDTAVLACCCTVPTSDSSALAFHYYCISSTKPFRALSPRNPHMSTSISFGVTDMIQKVCHHDT